MIQHHPHQPTFFGVQVADPIAQLLLPCFIEHEHEHEHVQRYLEHF